MALINKASLLMVPSTYEAGTLYNVLPSGNRAPDSTDQNSGYDQTRADFTFDRGSNAAATRVNASGLIEKYRENLLLQSNNFGTTWATTSASITSGQSGYDGTNNAWLLNESAVGGRIRQTISGSGVMTMSLYAKSGSLDYLLIYVNTTSSDPYAYFDLATGVLGNTSQTIDAKIEDAGNGWYRCSVTGSVGTLSAIEIYPANSTSSHTTTAGSVYIQSAQLEKGMVATDYLESTSVTGKAGVLVDLPRINYDANGENGALLLEPSRQNLFSFSEYFGDSYWVKGSGVSVVDNNYTSPEGLVNGAKLIGATGTDRSGSVITRIMSVSSSTTYTASIYVYRDTATQCTLYLRDGSTGVIVSQSVTLESGWQRIEKSLTTGASTSQMNWYLGNTDGDIGIYGAQLEANATYPSSYIPTMGTSETRAADSCLGAGDSSLFNVNGGVLFGEFSAFYDDGTFRQMGISGSTGNEVNLSFDSTSNRIGGIVRSGGTYYILSHVVSDTTINTKVALKYKVNDLALYVDGVEVDSLSSAAIPTSLNEFNFAIGTTNSNVFYGNVKQVAVFNEALSDSELATLTTL